jgi:hypothetical protein
VANVAPRSRFVAFGSAGVLVLAGVLAGAFVPGLTGQLLTLTLVTLGLIAAVSLLFLEVGLSEDRERERDAARHSKSHGPAHRSEPRLRLKRLPRRPE